MVRILVVCIVAVLGSSCTQASHGQLGDREYRFVSHDGRREINITPTRFSFANTGDTEGATKDGIGGGAADCSNKNFRCIALQSLVLAVPRASPPPRQWSAGGSTFRVVAELDRKSGKAWLVAAEQKGDTYAHFSFSERGIETLSLQDEGLPREVAVTYFLRSPIGPLAQQ